MKIKTDPSRFYGDEIWAQNGCLGDLVMLDGVLRMNIHNITAVYTCGINISN